MSRSAKSIKVGCDHCGASFRIKSATALGKTIDCPKCDEPFVLREVEPEFADFDQDFHEDYYDEPAEAPQALARPELRRLKKKQRKVVEAEEESWWRHGWPMWTLGGSIAAFATVSLWVLCGAILLDFSIFIAHVSLVPLGLGFIVGLGVRFAAGEEDGWGPGLTAAAITFLAILLAKLCFAYLIVLSYISLFVNTDLDVDTVAVQMIADEIIDERIDAGVEIGEPLAPPAEQFGFGVSRDIESQYPPDIWEEATERFIDMPLEEQQKRRETAEDEIERTEEQNLEVEFAFYGIAFLVSFGCFDIIGLPLAIFTAFMMGANASSS